MKKLTLLAIALCLIAACTKQVSKPGSSKNNYYERKRSNANKDLQHV